MGDGSHAREDIEWEPNFPRIRRIDVIWYRVERGVCGVMFLAMSLMVFAAVVADRFANRREPIDVVVLFGFCWLATRTRVLKEGEQRLSHLMSLVWATGLTAVIAGVVYLYVERYPGGFVWAQKLALVAMLWVALLGASIATYERAHLALELGEKLWPRKLVPLVKAIAHATTSAFTLMMLWLSIEMVSDNIDWEKTVEANEWLPSWVALLVVPYTFAAMTVRILAQACTTATGKQAPHEEQIPT